MRLMRLSLVAVVVSALAFGSVGAAYAAGRLVYMGPDPACHFVGNPEASTLAANAVRWAGNGNDPRILLVRASCGSSGVTMLQNAGFTQITAVSQSAFSTQTLTNFDVIYITHSANPSNFTSSAANLENFWLAGGGVVIEGGANSISWAPLGGQVNLDSRSSNVTLIVASHPVMSGLTDAGLSGWGSSSHSDFRYPAGGGFGTLAVDGHGSANIIVSPGTPQFGAAPLMGSAGMLGLVMLLLTCGLYGLRRLPRSE